MVGGVVFSISSKTGQGEMVRQASESKQASERKWGAGMCQAERDVTFEDHCMRHRESLQWT